MLPLRTRLAIAYIGFFAVALMALDIGLYLVVRQTLHSSAESELELTAQLLQQDFKNSNQSVRAYFDADRLVVVLNQPQLRAFGGTSLYIKVYQTTGELSAQSPNLQQAMDVNAAMQVDQMSFQNALNDQESSRTIGVGGAQILERWIPLYFKSPVNSQQVVGGVLQVGRSMRETESALNLLFYALIGGGVVVVLAAARGGAWLTRAALKPIDEITRTAQSIVRAEDLSRRVVVPLPEDELQRLTVTINELLGRLDGLFSAQQRFVADVSHELRTPLAAMQGNLEVLSRGASRDPELLNESLADMRREVSRLIRMTNDLLLLARSEAGAEVGHEPVELDTLLLEVHRELRPLANGVQLRIGEEDQVVVRGDRDRLKQALLNLGINGLQHTASGGTVTLSLAQVDGYARLQVSDTGSGIAQDDLEHIFERFYRVDRARNRAKGGAGLGLPIVKWIVESHGGQVLVESTLGVGSTFTMLLPNGAEPAPDETLQHVHQTTLQA